MASRNEVEFEEFLRKNSIPHKWGVNEAIIIENCPFRDNNKHSADFYLPEKDLYVEVKGQLTYYEVNILRFLLNHSGKNFYVMQMDNPDWIDVYDKAKHKSQEKKIQQNIEIQCNEILTKSTKDLVDISKKRIEEYVNRAEEIYRGWVDKVGGMKE